MLTGLKSVGNMWALVVTNYMHNLTKWLEISNAWENISLEYFQNLVNVSLGYCHNLAVSMQTQVFEVFK